MTQIIFTTLKTRLKKTEFHYCNYNVHYFVVTVIKLSLKRFNKLSNLAQTNSINVILYAAPPQMTKKSPFYFVSFPFHYKGEKRDSFNIALRI